MSKISPRFRSLNPDLLACGLLVTFFAATRLALVLMGVKLDIEHFYGHWQYLDLHLLKADYLKSIALLHSQPPLWNALLGAILNAVDGSEQEFLRAYSFFSFLISLCTALLVFFTLVRLKTTRIMALAASSVYITASSAYFYEVYIFYPLFTAFLAAAFFSSLAYAFSSRKDAIRIALSTLSCICLILLSVTWTLFHPVFVIATSWIIVWRAFVPRGTEANEPKPKTQWFALFTIGILLSLATVIVPLKNKVLYDHFGSGSWIGMNLSQVAPGSSKTCGFGPLTNYEINSSQELTRFTKTSSHPSINSLAKNGGDVNHNHVGYIVRSKSCRSEASKLIANNLLPFAKARILQFIRSNTMLSDSYFFYPMGMEEGSPARFLADVRNTLFIPISWEGSKSRKGLKARHHLAPLLIPIGLLAGGGLLVFLPSVRALLPAGSIEPLVAGLWLMTWLYAVSHLFNGNEQERMRFTIEPLFIAWLSLIGYYVAQAIRTQQPRTTVIPDSGVGPLC
jgi:hypothetical protein